MLLDELLGEVVNNDLVQGRTAQLVIVRRSQDCVHASAAGDHSHIGARTTQVGHHNQLVGYRGLRAGVVGHHSRDRLVDQLEHFDAGSIGRCGERLTLGVGEVGRDGDDGRIDLLTEEVRRRLLQPTKMAGGDLRDGNGVGGLAGGVSDGKGHGRVALLRMGRLVARGGVYRLEILAQVVSEVCDGVGGIADELGFGLCAVVLLALDVGENARDLAIWRGQWELPCAGRVSHTSFLVGNHLCLALLYKACQLLISNSFGKNHNIRKRCEQWNWTSCQTRCRWQTAPHQRGHRLLRHPF